MSARPQNRSSRGYRSIRDQSILTRLDRLVSLNIAKIYRLTRLWRESIDRLDRFRGLMSARICLLLADPKTMRSLQISRSTYLYYLLLATPNSATECMHRPAARTVLCYNCTRFTVILTFLHK